MTESNRNCNSSELGLCSKDFRNKLWPCDAMISSVEDGDVAGDSRRCNAYGDGLTPLRMRTFGGDGSRSSLSPIPRYPLSLFLFSSGDRRLFFVIAANVLDSGGEPSEWDRRNGAVSTLLLTLATLLWGDTNRNGAGGGL